MAIPQIAHRNTFSSTTVAQKMSSSTTMAKSKAILPKRGQSANHVGARSLNVPPRVNYQNSRFALNANTGMRNVYGSQQAYNTRGVGLNSLSMMGGLNLTANSAAAGSALGQQAYSTVIGILNKTGLMDKIKDKISGSGHQTNSNQIDQSLGSFGGGSAQVSLSNNTASTISNMAACSDSSSLSDAISGANGELQSLEGQVPTFEQAADTAKNNLKTLDNQKSIAQKGVTDAKSQVSTCEQSVKSATTGKEQALNKVKTGNEKYDKALENYSKAHDAHVDAQNNTKRAQATKQRADEKSEQATAARKEAQNQYNSAQQAYESCPDPITDTSGNSIPNPEKPKLKARAELLKQKLEQAERAEEAAKTDAANAKEALEKAQKAETDASEKVQEAKGLKDDAKTELGDLKDKAEEAEKTLEEQNKNLDKVKADKEKAVENFDVANEKFQSIQTQVESESGIVKMLKAHKNDISALKDAIGEQEKRLKTMKKQEAKEAKNNAKLKNSNNAQESQEVQNSQASNSTAKTNVEAPKAPENKEPDMSLASETPESLAEMTDTEFQNFYNYMESRTNFAGAQEGDLADMKLAKAEKARREAKSNEA